MTNSQARVERIIEDKWKAASDHFHECYERFDEACLQIRFMHSDAPPSLEYPELDDLLQANARLRDAYQAILRFRQHNEGLK